jgi:hypothetical protein
MTAGSQSEGQSSVPVRWSDSILSMFRRESGSLVPKNPTSAEFTALRTKASNTLRADPDKRDCSHTFLRFAPMLDNLIVDDLAGLAVLGILVRGLWHLLRRDVLTDSWWKIIVQHVA